MVLPWVLLMLHIHSFVVGKQIKLKGYMTLLKIVYNILEGSNTFLYLVRSSVNHKLLCLHKPLDGRNLDLIFHNTMK